ncbi:MAG: SUMF1/EgtB/PvdO family nonheme iron enzyme [Pseudomonadales bacterium]|nr:SUMF1/EgtB/PvdO family nonheme iron enzyme [Pseudomonadales bacterium]MCP5185115.1 SUMF1/EgtB/PvdO family nonheme iron enzyme [Pseudomonadales bacterium]
MVKKWGWLLAIAVGVGAIYVYQRFGTATVTVTSEPAGALVWIDGLRVGQTPLQGQPVKSGKHLVTLEHSWYADNERQINVQIGDHITHHAVLQAGTGTLVLQSNPRGAWVELNGQRQDFVTPARLTADSGVYTIVMGATELRPVTKEVVLADEETVEVNLDLNPAPYGSLTLQGLPAGATVELVGAESPYKPGVRLPVGKLTVRVNRPGYAPVEERIMISGGENVHRVNLARLYGILRVNWEPATAEVFVSAPGIARQRYREPMRLPTGSVEIRARAQGYQRALRRVTLAESGATVTLQLQPIRVTPGAHVRDALKSGGQGPDMVIIPAGDFRMGSDRGSATEKPVHGVKLLFPFAMSVTEVTVAQYLTFARATGRKVDKRVDAGAGDHAMGYVSWDDAVAYAHWLSAQTGATYRLPTEVEWEYAARAGSQSTWYFGDDARSICAHGNVADRSAWNLYREWDTVDCDDGMVRPGPVGRFAANAFGLKDVYGNVSEWVLDCDLPGYSRAPAVAADPEEDAGCETHGFRGGSWDSAPPDANSFHRASTSSVSDDRGIRLVREL